MGPSCMGRQLGDLQAYRNFGHQQYADRLSYTQPDDNSYSHRRRQARNHCLFKPNIRVGQGENGDDDEVYRVDQGMFQSQKWRMVAVFWGKRNGHSHQDACNGGMNARMMDKIPDKDTGY